MSYVLPTKLAAAELGRLRSLGPASPSEDINAHAHLPDWSYNASAVTLTYSSDYFFTAGASVDVSTGQVAYAVSSN